MALDCRFARCSRSIAITFARLKVLCNRYKPESFSEHFAWSSHASVYFNDLLPLPYTRQTLARVAELMLSTNRASSA